MYPAIHAKKNPDKPAFIMAGSGETVTYKELEQRTNRLAHLLRAHGLKHRDHYSTFMENNARCFECSGAGERSGLHYTCINSYLTADEVAYIVNNSESRALITSLEKLPVAVKAAVQCPALTLRLVVGGKDSPEELPEGWLDFESAVAGYPDTPIPDERLGSPMLYSSGTTGRPKGILRDLPDNPPDQQMDMYVFLSDLWQYREDMVYLSPAPLYHSAPQAANSLCVRAGGTSIVMERFDPEQYLALVEKYRVTHSQLVPTMFARMLKLPEAVRSRYDVSSLQIAVHAAAPCPVPVKQAMIDWWGPIIHEYYGATEGMGFTACDTGQWLEHPGTVGKVIMGDLHILDENMQPVAQGESGEIWFKTANQFEYFNDPERTAQSRSEDGTLSTVGDIGYVTEDGYLFLTDRATFMIISGGANVYPQEAENLLITHPKVMDAAVFGVPNEDLGEEVKAVVQPLPDVHADDALESELIAFCRQHLASIKCPRSIDFEKELPRLPTGKLYKRGLRDRYWQEEGKKI